MKIKYKELIDLGFERIDDHDNVWFNEFGYEYFRVEYRLSKRNAMDWDVQKQTVRLMRFEKDGYSIIEEREMESIKEIQDIIKMFGKRKKKVNPIEIMENQTWAA